MAKSLKLIIEALLFSSDKPLTIRDILSCLNDTKPSEIKSAIEVLKYEYESMDRSFELKEVAKGYQLRSRSEYGAYIIKLLQSTPNRLSRAAMETLAIIAYKQPILRHEIEKLRGVDVGGILRTLLEKGLIKIMGRKDLPGKPLIYGTTKRFLEVFDLKDISSLPKLKEIKAFGADEIQPTPVRQEESDEQEGNEEARETESKDEGDDEDPGKEKDGGPDQEGQNTEENTEPRSETADSNAGDDKEEVIENSETDTEPDQREKGAESG